MNLEGLAEAYREGRLSTLSLLARLEGQDCVPLSAAQRGMYLSCRMNPELTGYHVPVCFRSDKGIARQQAEEIGQTLLARFPDLRHCVAAAGRKLYWQSLPPDAFPVRLREWRGQRDAITAAVEQPFHLDGGPLLRIELFSSPERAETRLLLTFHHLLFDGYSLLPLFDTLLAVLEHARLPPLIASMEDYIRDEQRWLNGEEAAAQRAFWRRQLAGREAAEPLFDCRRSGERATRRQVAPARLTPALIGKMDAWCQRRRVGRATLLMAAWALLACRFWRRDDIMLGVPYIGRTAPPFMQHIGNFINMLPVRFKAENRQSFLDFVACVQQRFTEVLDNARYPFPHMVADCAASITHPLFQATFNYLSFTDDPQWVQRLERLRQAGWAFDGELHQTGEYCLSLDIEHDADGMRLLFKHDATLTDDEVRQIIARYLSLLEHALDDDQQSVMNLSLGNDALRRQIEPVQTADRSPDECTFYHLFLRQVEQRPDAPALAFERQTLSYRQLHQAVCRLSAHMARQGVAGGMIVALLMDRSPDMVIALLAVARLGAAWIPMDPDYPDERLRWMVTNGDVPFLLTQEKWTSRASTLADSRVRCLVTDRMNTALPGEPPVACTASGLAYVIYTSGSTGKPKGVMISQRSLTNFLLSMQAIFRPTPEDRLLAITTISFDIAGLELWLPLISGAVCYLAPSGAARNVERLIALIDEVRPSMMQATPVTWSMLFQAGWRNRCRCKMLCGGEALSDRLKLKLLENGEAWNMYGPTETTIWSSAQPLRRDEAIAIGEPIANTQLWILDENQRQVPPGGTGELCIGGAGVAMGYYCQPELTAARFCADPFRPGGRLYRTGDLACRRPDGAITLSGRLDDQIKIRGYRIEPGEIERVIATAPGIRECVVIEVDQRLVAYCLTEADDEPDHQSLRQHALRSLPDYMVPLRYIALTSYPLTPNKKIDRRALRDYYRSSGNHASDRQISSVRSRIRALFGEVLGVPVTDMEAGFFALGGNSVLAIELMDRVNQAFNARCSVTTLFQHGSVQALSRFLSDLHVADGAVGDEKPDQTARDGVAGRADYLAQSVAIIGIAGQFPGSADKDAFWRRLLAGESALKVVSRATLRQWGVTPATVENPDFVGVDGSLADKDQFDAMFFGLSPRDAEFLDPQARLLLQNAWLAVEDAGYAVQAIPDTAVVMSASTNFYQGLLPGLLENCTRRRVLDNADNYVAWMFAQGGTIPTLISHKLGLTGPSLSVNSNCSSSLVGLHLACQSILAGEVRQALVGAATIFPARSLGHLHQPGLNFSSDGRCKAFDAGADGMVGGEGAIVLLLKKASEAIADNDNIYALIRGAAVNNDGADKAGFYAPGVNGQQRAITQALRKAEVNPETIQYVEAHGTGTQLGDPIEFSALCDSWRAFTSRRQFCGLGSVKSNIGHLDTAAGLAGVVKVAMGLQHGVIPQTLHYQTPNPQLKLADSPFFITDAPLRLPADKTPWRAAVSAFGIGGTNAHVILEQWPEAARDEVNADYYLVPLSAKNSAGLLAQARALIVYLKALPPDWRRMTELAYTLQTGRVAMPARAGFCVTDRLDLIERLTQFLQRPGIASEATCDQVIELASLPASRDGQEQLIRRWNAGATIRWQNAWPAPAPRRLSLPGYQFARKRYWLGNNEPVNDGAIAAGRACTLSTLQPAWQAQVRERAARAGDSLSLKTAELEQMDRLMLKWLSAQLREGGFLADAEGEPASVHPSYQRWLAVARRWLNGVQDEPPQTSGLIKRDWQRWKQSVSERPEIAAKARLAEATLGALPDILSGNLSPTGVLFPSSSLHLVEGIYKNNPIADAFNQQLASCVADIIRRKRSAKADGKCAILEIGAGTGSTTEPVLNALRRAGLEQHLACYHFTDISPLFLNQAGETWGEGRPWLDYRLFDVSRAAEEQSLPLNYYDVIIATNVLHATPRIAVSLSNIHTLMAADGVLLLNEITDNTLLMHLTFGLLEGWWLYQDHECRQPGGPALSPQSWREQLLGQGFSPVLFPAAPLTDAGLQLIIAQRAATAAGAAPDGRTDAETQAAAAADDAASAGAQPRQAAPSAIENVLATALAQQLRMKPDEIQFDRAFADYGLDSLTGVALAETLQRRLQVTLPVAALFDYPSVERLSGFIRERLSRREAVQEAGESTQAPAGGPEPIAIIGISGRFPGADDPETWWHKLANGDDLTEEVTRWRDKACREGCPRGGFLSDIASFDPLFFNISGLEAKWMEPQQRIFLMECWKALEDAGYAGESIDKRCGVFVGCTTGDYLDLNSADYPAQAFWGNMSSMVPARVSYFLDLHGPAIAIDTACSSSLVAIHHACRSLHCGESSMALAGGVFVQCSPRLYRAASRAGMLSPTGRCHAFDQRANGFIPAEGVGVLVLKRLSEARRDGDHIYGVIAGSAINQDGATNGIIAPSALSQQRLQEQVFQRCSLSPDSIQYIETHGTGTPLGDPIEFQALVNSFSPRSPAQPDCLLGSVKANIGHAQMASGVIGVIKILLALKHRQIPPLVQYEQANPKIDLAASPFAINTQLVPWHAAGGAVRRAAISSFGASGTNAYLVIEEAPKSTPVSEEETPALIALSAHSERQLRRNIENIRQWLEKQPAASVRDIAWSLMVGRRQLPWRFACVVNDRRELLAALEQPSQHFIGRAQTRAGEGAPRRPAAADRRSHQQLARIARQFVDGAALSADALFDKSRCRRIPLPASSFASEPYWRDDRPAVARPKTAPAPHPLLGQPVSDGCFAATFDSEHAILRDHRIGRRVIMPASAFIEVARAALTRPGRETVGRRLVLSQLAWVQPLGGDGAAGAFSCETRLEPSQRMDNGWQVTVRSEQGTHFQCDAVWRAASSPADSQIAALQAQFTPLALNQNEFYAAWRELGLNYGPVFQGVRRLYRGAEGLLARIALSTEAMAAGQGCLLHPAALDCVFQSVKYLTDDQAGERRVRLLFAVREAILLREIPASLWAWVRPAGGDARQTVDIDLLDDDGRFCLTLRGVATRAAAATDSRKAAYPARAWVPVWKPCATAPGQSPTALPSVAICDRDDLWTPTLAARLSSCRMADWTALNDQDALAALLAPSRSGDHLLVCVPEETADDLPARLQFQRRITGDLFRLIKAAIRLRAGKPLRWTVVTRRGAVSGDDDLPAPTHSAVHGMFGVLAKEYPEWSVAVLDTDKRANCPLEELLRQAADPDGNPQAWRGGQWFRSALTPLVGLPARSGGLRQGGRYLLVGGAGGLGYALSEYLVRRYQAQLFWFGRRAPDETIDAKIRRLSAFGPAPVYCPVDARDLTALRHSVALLREQYGDINGVFQAALIMKAGSYQRLDEADFNAGISAKADISINLAQALYEHAPDFTLYLSSINSWLKAMGQSSYAAACNYQDAIARLLDHGPATVNKVLNLGYCFNNADPDKPENQRLPADQLIGATEFIQTVETLLASPVSQLALIKDMDARSRRGLAMSEEWVRLAESATLAPGRAPEPDDEAELQHIRTSHAELNSLWVY